MSDSLQRVIADGHLHMYPCFKPALAMRHLFDNLDRLAALRWPDHEETAGVCPAPGGMSRMAFLAERSDCHFFRDLREGRGMHGGPVFAFLSGPEPNCVVCREEGRSPLLLVAGRQVVTRERLEVLALTLDEAPEDGAPACEVIDDILHAGGLPVLSWAPGKWFFKRGQIVRDLLDRFDPGGLLLGDSSLRPTLWGLPFLMRRAMARGFRVIAGSDPLPFAGEERVMGAYGFSLDCRWDEARPVSSIREALQQGPVHPRLVGRRGSPGTVLHRLKQYHDGRTKP
ncbi:MAG: hypothetical protein HY343_09015 [Lentisphaerae bacterium]|nr:hypothetical protein [Lentisphaerota bacterium]